MRSSTRWLATALVSVSAVWTAEARADDGACTDVRVVVHGSTGSPTPAKLIGAIIAEVSSHASTPCEGEQRRPIAGITVDLEAHKRARVRLDLSDRGNHYVTTRDVDLTRITEDASPLALAIAADELLQEARANADADAAAAVMPVAPNVVGPAQEAPATVDLRAQRRWSFGSGVGVEWFSSSVTLVGPDATLDWAAARRLTLSAHLGLRAAVEDELANEHLALASAGVWGRFVLAGGRRRGVGLGAGLDTLALATPTGDLRAVLVPGAAFSTWYRVASWCRLSNEIGGGIALGRLAMADGSAVSGGELRARVSLLVDF